MPGLSRGLSSLLSDSKAARQLREQQAEQTQSEQVISPMPLEGISVPERHAAATVTDPAATEVSAEAATDGQLKVIPVSKLRPSAYQPRNNFDNESLAELASSIAQHGILEPLLVKGLADGSYQIICGERRYRACIVAGIQEAPCLVRDVLDDQAYAVALIENIQREDLNPMEQAEAMQRMLSECNLTQEALAETLGKSRSAVANILRLNNLHEGVKQLVNEGSLSLGHAKVLLALDGEPQLKAARLVAERGYNVRQTENFVRQLKDNGDGNPEPEKPKAFELFSRTQLAQLTDKFAGAKVQVRAKSEEEGRITLSYESKEQLQRILEALGAGEAAGDNNGNGSAESAAAAQ